VSRARCPEECRALPERRRQESPEHRTRLRQRPHRQQCRRPPFQEPERISRRNLAAPLRVQTSPDAVSKDPTNSGENGENRPPPIEAEVLVYVGEENTVRYSLTQGEYLIGRDKSCQVCVEADGVSRHHARLTLTGYELIIEDLGSSNGVFIEGVQIQLPTRVRPDQQVEVGSARLFIRLKAESFEMLEAALWDPDLGLAPVRTLLVGKKYKVLGTIGRGGMGVIHQARQHYEKSGHREFVHSETGIRTLQQEFDKIAAHNEHHLSQIALALRNP